MSERARARKSRPRNGLCNGNGYYFMVYLTLDGFLCWSPRVANKPPTPTPNLYDIHIFFFRSIQKDLCLPMYRVTVRVLCAGGSPFISLFLFHYRRASISVSLLIYFIKTNDSVPLPTYRDMRSEIERSYSRESKAKQRQQQHNNNKWCTCVWLNVLFRSDEFQKFLNNNNRTSKSSIKLKCWLLFAERTDECACALRSRSIQVNFLDRHHWHHHIILQCITLVCRSFTVKSSKTACCCNNKTNKTKTKEWNKVFTYRVVITPVWLFISNTPSSLVSSTIS